MKAWTRPAVSFALLTAFALSASACLARESTIAWNGIQAGRQEVGIAPLAWDGQMYPFTERRAIGLAETGHYDHAGFGALVADYRRDSGYRDWVCEILMQVSPRVSAEAYPGATLIGWQASAEHWTCAMRSDFTHAAIAQAWGDDALYVVMWLRK